MTYLRRTVIAFAALFGFAAASSATTLTFDAGVQGFISSYTESGFQFTFTGGAAQAGNAYHATTTGCGPSCVDDGTPWLASLVSFQSADTLIVKALDNHAFTFDSVSGAESFSQRPFFWASAIQVTGVRADTTTAVQNLVLDQINDGTGGVADFQSFVSTLSGPFVELRFTGLLGPQGGHDFTIDNLTLGAAAVPEPASLLLLGSGLLVGIRRGRKRSAV